MATAPAAGQAASDDELVVVAASCGELFASRAGRRPPVGEWDAALWRALEDAGLTLVSVPESAGGSGGGPRGGAAGPGRAGGAAAPGAAAGGRVARRPPARGRAARA